MFPLRRVAFGKVVLAPLIVGYELGLVPGSVVRAAIVKFGFSGVFLAALQTSGLEFAQRFPRSFDPKPLNGSIGTSRKLTLWWSYRAFDVYLSQWCKAHNLDLICSSLEDRDGVLTGRYFGRQCVHEEKAHRVKKAYDLSRYERIYAYGDTKEDLDLLALAHEQYYQWQLASACA